MLFQASMNTFMKW